MGHVVDLVTVPTGKCKLKTDSIKSKYWHQKKDRDCPEIYWVVNLLDSKMLWVEHIWTILTAQIHSPLTHLIRWSYNMKRMLVMIEHSKINILQIRFISHQRLSTIIKNHNHKCNPNIMPMLYRNFLIKNHHDASVWFKCKCEQLCKHKISQQDFQLLALE